MPRRSETQGELPFPCIREQVLIPGSSATMYISYSPTIRWPFQPVVDNDYVKQSPTASWRDGSFNKVPVITGFNTDEGSGFVPRNLNTTADYRAFWATLFPLANSTVLDKIEALYPDPVTTPSSPYANSALSPQFQRVSAAYGDYAYISTVKENAESLARGGAPVWKYHFNYTATRESWSTLCSVCDVYRRYPYSRTVRRRTCLGTRLPEQGIHRIRR